MKNISVKVVKETKQFSKKIKEEVSCMKNGFMKKMKKYNEKMKSLQKHYLERCRNIEFDNSSSIHDSVMKFTEDDYETFSKYFTTDEINELINKSII
jgi:excinuclease UvrABC helicase subunit UvrB